MSEYAKSNDGLIHLINPIQGEFTLCGNAFDGDADGRDFDPFEHDFYPHGPVTCPNCAEVIKECRGVRIRLKT